MDALKQTVMANLAAFPRLALQRPDLRPAAVTVLISPVDGAPTFALTRRALTMRRGAGNYALPGGNLDAGESPEDGALRETWEELGVALPAHAALGRLDDFVTLGGHMVTPVVAWSDAPLTLKPDPTEVHDAWLIPLEHLDHPQSPRAEAHPDGGEPILRMFANGQWINPPTAAFLYQFREVALHGRWTRVAGVGQPPWTAR
ncbi:NUDIX hydrolase [Caulobacter sp. KR2-114]|uniref:NUDIX hydrolase n=1 Tax=Caulobacter sp. KR2-114 TaxID=3400912 RepID=UPI003C061100